MIRVSPEMRDAAQSIIYRVRLGNLTDDVNQLAKYLDQQAKKRTDRLIRKHLDLPLK